jgi:hypothetical protein
VMKTMRFFITSQAQQFPHSVPALKEQIEQQNGSLMSNTR